MWDPVGMWGRFLKRKRRVSVNGIYRLIGEEGPLVWFCLGGGGGVGTGVKTAVLTLRNKTSTTGTRKL